MTSRSCVSASIAFIVLSTLTILTSVLTFETISGISRSSQLLSMDVAGVDSAVGSFDGGLGIVVLGGGSVDVLR